MFDNKITPLILHHGATQGVTGSCHELVIDKRTSVLIDCGLFQGEDSNNDLSIEFPVSNITALIVTHCHIDHVGRIPYLLAVGFSGPIYCSPASAKLLPLVIEDALKVGVTRDQRLIDTCLKLLQNQIVSVPFKVWQPLPVSCTQHAKFRLQRAGHILGSAYVEVDVGKGRHTHRVIFSGDLGAPHTPLLPSPKTPYKADTLVLESTYGNKNHEGRKFRTKKLQQVIEKAVSDNGVVLIPAFSMGRTQELLYEIEQIIHSSPQSPVWQSIEVIIDSPMAANFTQYYLEFKDMWDKEAKRKVINGRHPLDFSNVITIDTHKEHMAVVNHLAARKKPAIVIAASGMCQGGRIVNYLEQFLPEPTADVIFVGYQGKGTLGREIQTYGPKKGYVTINGQRIFIKAGVHTITGYSAHADQNDLLRFASKMVKPPSTIKLVHGDEQAKQTLKSHLIGVLPRADVQIPK